MKEEQEVELFLEKRRIKTFKSFWPYPSSSQLSKEKMAAAGFYYTGNKNEPDSVQCFFCFKELAGWEDEDDPWVEHSRYVDCPFVQLNKSESEMNVLELYDLIMQRMMKKVKNNFEDRINSFKEQAKEHEEKLRQS